MSHRSRHRALRLTMLGLLALGCAASSQKRTRPDDVPWQAYWHFTNGDLLEMQGQTQAALTEYLKALEYDPGSVDVRLAAARAYGQMGWWRQATEIMEETSKLVPSSAGAHLVLGECYSHVGRIEEAKKSYIRAVKLDPGNVQAHHHLALLYEWQGDVRRALHHYDLMAGLVRRSGDILVRQARLLVQLGRMDEALTELNRAVELEPELVEAHIGLAQTWEMMGQPEESIGQYQKAIQLMPRRSELRIALAELLLRQSRPQEAMEQYRQIVAQDSTEYQALKRLAILQYHADQLPQAQEAFEALGRATPQDPHVPLFLGRIRAQQDDPEGAIGRFQEATALNDTLAQAWIGLGLAWLQKQDNDQAERSMKRAVILMPQHPGLHHLLGVCFLRQEKYLAAVGTLEKALSLAPQNLAICRDLAMAYERAGYFQKAVDLFQQVLTRQPDDHWALNYLGYMLADAGVQLDLAGDLIRRALELSPNNPYYMDSMGWVYFRLGDLDLSQEYLLRAAEQSTDQAVIYDHLGDVYLQLGKPDEAIRQWQKAIQLSPDDSNIRQKLDQYRP